MRIHKNLIEPKSNSILPYILCGDALLFAFQYFKKDNENSFLGNLAKTLVINLGTLFVRNNVEVQERLIEFKTPIDIDKIDIKLPNHPWYHTLKSTIADEKESVSDCIKACDDILIRKTYWSNSDGTIDINRGFKLTLEGVLFSSQASTQNSLLDYALLVADAALCYTFLKKPLVLLPSLLSVLTCGVLDLFGNNNGYIKGDVPFVIRISKEPDADGFYDCAFFNKDGEFIPTAPYTEVIV